MKEYTLEAIELRILAKAALITDHDHEAFHKLSEDYRAICGHPPFCGFDDYSYEGADKEAKIERDWVLAAKKVRAMETNQSVNANKKEGFHMIGAMLGDMIGAPYEFDRGAKTKDFPLFGRGSHFTNDSVMTAAVAEALMESGGRSDDEIKAALIRSMQKWGRRYPDAGYGGRFIHWLFTADPQPNGSYGNGSAMRASAAGWMSDDVDTVRHLAALTAEVSHNHPEGIKGAEATAAAICLARNGSSLAEIKAYTEREFGYDLSGTCAELRPKNRHNETCQVTMPLVFAAFLESTDFEDAIRNAVSLGGDTDTIACITGSIAEAFYGVPAEIEAEGRKRLPDDMLALLDWFTAQCKA